MELESLFIPATNRFASLYLQQQEPVAAFFDYNINDKNVFQNRLEDLKNREFPRGTLVDCIEEYMSMYPQSPAVKHSLEKLRADAVAVVGGQQAGLLTGPLYSIHKIISIIKLAQKQEKELGTPVVPVFWVAGEDHDYLEINHLFVEENDSMKKVGYPERVLEKRMATDIHYSKEQMEKWVNDILKLFGESKFTRKVQNLLKEAISKTSTFVEFFSYIIMTLFKDYGLLIIDSAYSPLRKLEKPYFSQIIEGQRLITDSLLSQQKNIQQHGFENLIDISGDAVNLFLNEGNERFLLEWKGGDYQLKNHTIKYSKLELENILSQTPERFSNNVVTRPLMQEWLFPTLAFIAGPGEIAYWGELKEVFKWAGLKMPPIIPRLNITLLERNVEKYMNDLELSFEDALISGVENRKAQFLLNVNESSLEEELEKVEEFLRYSYKSIRGEALKIEKGLEPLIEKNLNFHLDQLSFLKRKAEKSTLQKHSVVLRKFDRIQNSLKPNGSPQERIWNIYYFINHYGPGFIDELLRLDYEFDGTHKLIRI
ncbi:bacillithiol biosynthesis cysteine-adding enzyme BshC [Bacillus pakistanensis]|uniref:Putative cysteine ligase BshC n=1 Tax=Rossellomorea pakistanensis TaxID=992288 RepID=A0ABS2NFU9_9BACI|nr:bacillithiol biosynthesis cysteine-adding enzyme BshC [Bacillus pakistanensis]MBM7586731.1 bacillithiol biosynthesis cysteine-adding enzyme BshC [Bacillus pakistanensis]